jgi:GLPGLI family protein
MKTTFIIFLVAGLTAFLTPCKAYHSVFSQDISKYKVVDRAKMRITYSLQFKYTPQDGKYNEDTRIVLVGSKMSKDFSAPLISNDSVATALRKKGADATPVLQQLIYPYEIFNNYNNGKCLMTYRTFLNCPVLRFFDTQPVLKWEFTDETETVMGYKCQLATTSFAGRDYNAWYTVEVPLNAGPYKFGGLPGLILKVEDSERFFIWTAIGISKTDEPIVEYELPQGYLKCTVKQANETIKRMYTTPYTFIATYGSGEGIYITRADGSIYRGTAENEPNLPYEPLEK